MPNVTINGKPVSAPEGTTILAAARSAGVEIPSLCEREGVSPCGSCRVCLVEVRQASETRFAASCQHAVREGMEILTDTSRVRRARRIIIELMLARSPDSAAIKDLAAKYGVGGTRFSIKHEDCILCGRCVQVCSEVVGAGALGFIGRGSERRVGVPMGTHYEACIGCGACTYVCPTGAIQMEAEAAKRFRSRSMPGGLRCRHARLGSVSFRACAHNFQCSRCDFDQTFEDSFKNHPSIVVKPAASTGIKRFDRFAFAQGYEYGPGHLWTKRINGHTRVGIDDIAIKIIGRILDIRPLRPGAHGEFGAISAVVKGLEGKIALLTFPFAGTIKTVNPLLSSDPAIPLKDPYLRGWIYDIQPDPGVNQGHNRYIGKEAESWFMNEIKNLANIGSGGQDTAWTPDSALPGEEWKKIAKQFLFPKKTGLG